MSGVELVFSAVAFEQLHSHLLREDGLERFAFASCGQSGDRSLAADIRPVDDEDLAQQGEAKCRPHHELEYKYVKECANEGKHPLFIHSHPFADKNVGFSGLDDEMMSRVGSWLKPHYPDTEVLFAVFGERSVVGGRYNEDCDQVETIPVEVPGEWMLEDGLYCPSSVLATDSKLDEQRYDRNIRALTEDGQQELAATRVGVIGLGGLGSIIAGQLTRLGIEDLVLVDPDVVERSNLPRLQGATLDDVGQPKVSVAKNHLEAINSELRIETHSCAAQEAEQRLQQCDLLIGGVDRMNARMWINEFAVKHLIPFVDTGVLIENDDGTVTAMKGFVQTIVPGATPCFCCLNRDDSEQARIERMDDEELQAEIEQGYVEDSVLTPEPAVIHLNGLAASKAVDELVRLVTGVAEPDSMIIYQGFDNNLKTIDVPPAPQCTVCGGDMLGRGNSLPDFPEIGSIEGDTMEAN